MNSKEKSKKRARTDRLRKIERESYKRRCRRYDHCEGHSISPEAGGLRNSKLGPDEKWVSRGFKADEVYKQWGK